MSMPYGSLQNASEKIAPCIGDAMVFWEPGVRGPILEAGHDLMNCFILPLAAVDRSGFMSVFPPILLVDISPSI